MSAAVFVRLITLGLGIGLTGCSTLLPEINKPEQAYLDIPVKWQIESVDQPIIEKPFLNSVSGLLMQSKLTSLIKEALDHNPDLNQLALEVQASGLLLKQVSAKRVPTLDLVMNASKNRRFENITNSYEFGLNVAWEIDLWGQLADLESATESDFTAQKWEYTAVRNLIAMSVVRLWLEGWALSEIQRIEQRYLGSLNNVEKLVLESYRDGLVQLADLSAIRVQQESTRSDMIATIELISRNHREMELLLGRAPSADSLIDVNELPEIMMPPTILPAKVIAQRPDIQAAFYRLKSNYANRFAQYKALLPSININGSLSKVGDSASLNQIFGSDIVWSLVGGVAQPLFNSGSLRAQAEASSATAEASWWAYRKTVLTSLQEVENALFMEHSLAQQLDRLAKVRLEVMQMKSINEEKYRSGLVDIFDLIESRLAVLEIDAHIIQMKAARMDNRMLLALAMGFGLEAANENK
ncbi:Outer membrane protein TolC [Neptunomonas antarctica]|uniref:Outer membrane protein TolC n=2 Tax=Neptunomonas antarctica TaxID=619304 RepID=A0A1N7NI85_9GAMM|nr:Outer membrane protein TolC [Neptunomonas antarctica]